MIEIINKESNDESEAASYLKELFLDKWPFLENADDQKNWLKIFVEPFLNRGSVKSSDLVVLGAFDTPQEVGEGEIDKKKIFLKNFCLTIELKNHSGERIKFEGGKVKVYYQNIDYWKNVSTQADQQWFALVNHIRCHKSDPALFGGYGIILPNVTDKDIKRGGDGKRLVRKLLVNGDEITSLLEDVADELIRLNRYTSLENDKDKKTLSCFDPFKENYFKESSFFPSYAISNLDQKRMLEISKGRYQKEWEENVGKKLLVFKGHGGTGKTVRLIQTAQKLIISENASCLFLTFNIPLRSNLLRLARLMGIHLFQRDETDYGGIVFEGVMKFCSVIIKHANEKHDLEIDIGDKINWESFLQNLYEIHPKSKKTYYDHVLQEFYEYIKTETITREELRDLAREAYSNVTSCPPFSYGFIDECQDWSPCEKDIVMAYFGSNKLICAHGLAQETRGSTLSWTKGISDENKYEARLSKAVRMKRNLAKFVKDFSQQIFPEDLYQDMDIEEGGVGGNIYIVEGDYKNFFKFEEGGGLIEDGFVRKSMKRDDTKPIDYLYCVPDNMDKVTLVKKDSVKLELSSVGAILHKNKVPVWDATTDTRNNTPKTEEIRIVNYSTCRGLEGWIVFNFDFDMAFNRNISEYKKKKYREELIAKEERDQSDFFEEAFDEFEDKENEEKKAISYAAKFALIALTRGVSEIVIFIRDKNSRVGRVLKTLHEKKEYEGVIHWENL